MVAWLRGPLAADLGPPGDQVLVSARQAAQARDLLGAGLLMLTLALREPELDPRLLREQAGRPSATSRSSAAPAASSASVRPPRRA